MLVIYITAHGFGHAARTCQVLNALRSRYPQTEMLVVSDLPDWFLDARLPGVMRRRASLDVGMVQKDAVRVDLEATRLQLKRLCQEWQTLLQQEKAWLSDLPVHLVLADIPALPLQAAAELKIPNIALGNFGWDEIYAEFSDQDQVWRDAVSLIDNAYRRCDRLLRYPFHSPMTAFSNVEEIPVVAAPGADRRQEMAQRWRLDVGKPWLLFVFSQLEFSSLGQERIAALENVQLLTTGALNWRGPNVFNLDPDLESFSDLVASGQGVVSKPGFGILSDCVVNHTPLIYVEREDFSEYAILVEAVERYLRHRHLPFKSLLDGDLEAVLEGFPEAWDEPSESLTAEGGADIVAERLWRCLQEG